jgi:hypothetical protein
VKRVMLLCVVAVLLVGGCTVAQRQRVEKIATGASQVLKGAATTVATTPAAPIAPILLLLSMGAGILAELMGRGSNTKGVEMATEKKLVPTSLLGSRKNKLTAIGFIIAGLITFARIQWDLPESVTVALLGLVTIVTGANINGIAKEDAAEKSNPTSKAEQNNGN